jgi:hypothetical protein
MAHPVGHPTDHPSADHPSADHPSADRPAARTSAGPPAPPARASDAERHATVLTVQDAMARGLLTPDEAGDRMTAAYRAVHRRDLAPLTADLPPAPPTAPSAPPGWSELAALAGARFRASFGTSRRSGALVLLLLAVLLGVLLVLVLGHLAAEMMTTPGPGPGGPGRR